MTENTTKNREKKLFDIIYEGVSAGVITLAVMIGAAFLLGVRAYEVRSGSMGELMPVGSVCFVSTYADFGKIRAGDIIAFRVSEDMLVTHRAVRVTEDGIYTKGDENESEDPDPVTRENFIGKTFFDIPRAGRALEFFHSVGGRILLLTFALAVTISGLAYRGRRS